MRVRDTVSVSAFVDHGLPAYLEQRDARRRIEIAVAATQQPLLAGLADQGVEPVVIAEADAYQQLGAPHLRKITGARLECFGIGRRPARSIRP